MTLYDLAAVVRSKNAGPFTLTIDLIFRSEDDVGRALRAPGFEGGSIARLYGVDESSVRIHELPAACAVKVTMPRKHSSGSAADRDVYGSQQHMLLAAIRVPEGS